MGILLFLALLGILLLSHRLHHERRVSAERLAEFQNADAAPTTATQLSDRRSGERRSGERRSGHDRRAA